ncbi:E3 ubiquitin-protein ligase MARCHF2 isoform X3 [Cinclus cinclus]|uniref:E3 ubiquitin-protein ligase MARCHF2 isoform X3 n=1 Tax=Cinclus cinclus TaxID=127875 RepID=UPI002E0DA1E8
MARGWALHGSDCGAVPAGLPGAGPGTQGSGAAMTTGDCCHLPGSLCDCPGSAALSKSVEDSDMGRPQYITQVTAKDGRLLSTVIKALGAQSDGPICRICHEGGNGEGLLSPCDCTGTLGTVHKSCLEKWLSSSNTSYCELCHTEFVVERRPRPLTEVSFRYHCQLYSEWRRTNQKVRLMIPASRSPHSVPHSLLSAKLVKKTADETTV